MAPPVIVSQSLDKVRNVVLVDLEDPLGVEVEEFLSIGSLESNQDHIVVAIGTAPVVRIIQGVVAVVVAISFTEIDDLRIYRKGSVFQWLDEISKVLEAV